MLQVVIFGSAMDIAAIQQDTPQARERFGAVQRRWTMFSCALQG